VDHEGHPIPVPCAIAETEHQKRRFADAGRRREMRGEETQRARRFAPRWGRWHI